ncbi:RluA family pseudouridine synthase [Aporhodopirellula aestuarii]|uniref:Pseudouridine synthase n=1 Tax=Aporhodopirellula aestuarii TaxID=2950107 RepID=A0ABT0U8K6_9BACT|nr:RluA family pseudouridine synthase [Aporhodopirellula aestuarii]MCM2373245.1 RluA family pseudouridine synthase [Aporhodopirellula aestuarii]
MEDTGEAVRSFVVPESADGSRIDLFLTQVCDGLSRSQIRLAVQNDGAEIDGRIVRPSFKVRAGQNVRFRLPVVISDETVAENIPLDILYEDDGMVVINKPAGMVVHPARGNWTGTLTSALAFRFQSLSDVGGPARPGIVHRLDRDTSGVIVVAKNNAVHLHLSAQWHDRQVQKTYLALTAGRLDRDRDWINASIGRHPYQRDKQAIRENHETSKPASTFYEVISRHGRVTQVKVSPKTGRTHQIRVHLAHIGCPILCDRLYAGHAVLTRAGLARASGLALTALAEAETPAGSTGGGGDEVILDRQALHAHQLTLVNPQTQKEMTFTAPLPADMGRVVRLLG